MTILPFKDIDWEQLLSPQKKLELIEDSLENTLDLLNEVSDELYFLGRGS